MQKRGAGKTWIKLIVALELLLTALPGAAPAHARPDRLPAPAPAVAAGRPASNAAPSPTVALRAASGATIALTTQNGQDVAGARPRTLDLPHLVLRRNGELAPLEERTLVVELAGLAVPPAGLAVTLTVETEHGDPDVADPSPPITVWREARRLSNTAGVTRTGVSTAWTIELGDTIPAGGRAIRTPTDYYSLAVVAADAARPAAPPLFSYRQGYALLVEEQWLAPLPAVAEASPGAAPDELIVYYCDMFPFRRDTNDPATWLPRSQVGDYVRSQLLPAMVHAFRVETDDWGFSWYEEWTGYRPGPDRERLSVALTDRGVWFHGRAPLAGHAGMSLNVNGGPAGYDSLAAGVVSTFYHELFHNLQRNLYLHLSGGRRDGPGRAWDFFGEGTAVLASSAGRPEVEFGRTWGLRSYMADARGFVGRETISAGDLNTSYERMNPYHGAAYWRFLYEQCGGMAGGVERPAAGMAVIRRALVALYRADAGGAAGDLVAGLPGILDRALGGSACPFQTYEDSLRAFARAVYGLRLDGGRCLEPGLPAGCGLYDPRGLYSIPPAQTMVYTGGRSSYGPAGIPASFGIDLIEVALAPEVAGRPLVVELYPAAGGRAELSLEVVYLLDPGDGALPRAAAAGYNRLGLVITRTDAREASDSSGGYTIVLRAGP